MTVDVSPAVERAAEAAREWAKRLGAAEVRFADWVLGLLSEEEGKPAILLESLGAGLELLRAGLQQVAASSQVAWSDAALFAVAQERSVQLRGEATLTTEFVLLATVEADPELQRFFMDHGLPTQLLKDRLHAREIVDSETLATQLPELVTEGADCLATGTGAVTVPPGDRHLPGTGADIGLSNGIPGRKEQAPRSREDPSSFSRPEPWRTRDTAADDRSEARPQIARVLDANLNRAREALRVLEDYARFCQNRADASAQFKTLRHQLAEAARQLPASMLLEHRDTVGDVGTRIGLPSEYRRESLSDLVTANWKRLQEALRSLEEFGKLLPGDFARAIEPLRYQAYTLERQWQVVSLRRARLERAQLYLLVGESDCVHGLERTIFEAAAGGVDMVQLREKNRSDRELLVLAEKVRRWTEAAGVLMIVNDRADLARLVGADGVHLGQEDLPVAVARNLIGPELVIGVSTHTPSQIDQALRDGADYLGVGPAFPSRTKSFSEFPGLELIPIVARESSLPAFILGGIDADNLSKVVAAGARRIAVSAAIARSDDPRRSTRELRAQLPPLDGIRNTRFSIRE